MTALRDLNFLTHITNYFAVLLRHCVGYASTRTRTRTHTVRVRVTHLAIFNTLYALFKYISVKSDTRYSGSHGK